MSEEADLQAATEKAQAVKNLHASELLGKANVVGVGVGFRKVSGAPTRQVGLVVMVSRKLPVHMLAPRDLIPREIDGVPVDVQEIGEVRAFPNRKPPG